MRRTSVALPCVGWIALLLVACGGGGGGSGANRAPSANAGPPQVVNVGQVVTLSGAASSDPDGDIIASYQWTQVGGTAVALANAGTFRATFTMPDLPAGTTLTFSLVVTDANGLASAPATVTVTVSSVQTQSFSGLVRYERVPFMGEPTFLLDYASTVMLPARGVVVRALNSGNQVLASAVTSDTGTYSLTVPTNTSIRIQVEARLLREGPQPLPAWNVRVQNGTGSLAPYTYTSAAVNSSAGTQNVDIPVGINAGGSATGTRASGPFAILDTIFTTLQLVKDIEPSSYPPLYVDWGSNGVGASFTPTGGLHINLGSSLTEDTDEFDQDVIAHEFGHYLQYVFSRSDSIGGTHALGDELDPRLAFNEGFATAFGAIALGHSLYLDSYVDNGQRAVFGYDVEVNPPDSLLGDGCWCNEASIWSLVWDLHDANADGNDNVQLPFQAIWAAVTGAGHRNTPSLATIFSFLASLKSVAPDSAATIDTLVAAQNITGPGIDAFASTETHAPHGDVSLLPVFANIVPGTPVVLRTTDDKGRYNTVGNHRFLRFTPATTGTYTVKLTTSNPNGGPSDPDFQIFQSGLLIKLADSEPSASGEVASFTAQGQTTYVIDAYDCANGCDTPQGVPGDYDLTVTIN